MKRKEILHIIKAGIILLIIAVLCCFASFLIGYIMGYDITYEKIISVCRVVSMAIIMATIIQLIFNFLTEKL